MEEKCTHIYGYSSLYDRLVYDLEDEHECLKDSSQSTASTYPYEKFNYCPECGDKLIRN